MHARPIVDAARRFVDWRAARRRRRRAAAVFSTLDERMLRDIGVDRADIPRLIDRAGQMRRARAGDRAHADDRGRAIGSRC